MPLSLFGSKDKQDNRIVETVNSVSGLNLPEDQREQLAREVSMLETKGGTHAKKLQNDAEREVISAVEDSIRKLHVVELGRCPSCGGSIYRHLGCNICDACGWHQYDMPKRGKVKVHLKGGDGWIDGERAYVLKSGDCLVVRGGVVVGQVPAQGYSWVEYCWEESEIKQRHVDANEKLVVPCGWCGAATNPNQDGFHLVHAAFGSSQERYCFCCDDCYEAFRKMYPARVHRDCYERECNECGLCLKRYDDDASEMRILAKDYIKSKRER
jgi:hypothetical protein